MKYISDNNKEIDSDGYVSSVTRRILAVIKTIPDDEMRPLSWVAKKANSESANGGFYLHPLIMPHRIKCNVDGRQRVWFGSIAGIKAEKKLKDKTGEHYSD